MKNEFKLWGFTLGEILIALGIIGVIAAITIPALVSSYNKKIFSSQLKKVYAQINLAIEQIVSDEAANQDNFNTNESEDFSFSTDYSRASAGEKDFYLTTGGMAESSPTSGAQYFLDNYFKSTDKNCAGSCTASAYKTASGSDLGDLSSLYCIKTPAGAAICMKYYEADDITYIVVDTNGRKAPNTAGLDLFVMRIAEHAELEDASSDPELCGQDSGLDTEILSYPAGCLTKVIDNGWQIE